MRSESVPNLAMFGRRACPNIAKFGVVVLVGVLLAGCSTGEFRGVYDLPLPGGADLGAHPFTVTAEFANVLDLVPQAAVKVNDIAVGRVANISLPKDAWTARVTLQVNGDVELPANARATLRQSSLLGEKYVELAAPDKDPAGRLADGAQVPLTHTTRSAEVEEVLGAMALLLNGGGLEQVNTISKELNKALAGNEPELKSLLGQLNSLASTVDAHKEDIGRALDGLNALSTRVADRRQKLRSGLDELPKGLAELEAQRGRLVGMLDSLHRLSDITTSTVNASKDNMVASLRAIQPVLDGLVAAGDNLPKSLQILASFPFTDAVTDGIKGDYLNTYLQFIAQPGTTVIPPLTPPPAFPLRPGG
ncbi:MCE family protein [Pseudonocardiaceae bacterium YIM PH 21723]|nr:MCE family protein [Pseudonocardiaceae bacterium YIM PH 21723]